jgi:hypothetical protein
MLILFGGVANAVQTLQLDIGGGNYVGGEEETIFSSGPVFNLYAYLEPGGASTLGSTYYISAALVPKTGPTGGDYGSFKFNSFTVNVTDDMIYGVPPLETVLGGADRDPGDLSRHGIFETFYTEYAFKFDADQQSGIYDTQAQTGQGPIAGTGMYYQMFSIDTSGLTGEYAIHFDLYNEKYYSRNIGNNPVGDIDVRDFAPFSHDAQSKVPEPGTLLLFGIGLIGFAAWGRKGFGG